jgi:hypothetical protein
MARKRRPIITAPTKRGFGTRLLPRALDQFGGIVETTFEPTGLICKLIATLPEEYTASIESDVMSTLSKYAREALLGLNPSQ